MKRVLIIGCGGAGKSTLARKVGEILNIEVIHLDIHFWKPGWIESSPEEWKNKVGVLTEKNKWIMDGNYSGTMPERFEAADTIIFLDMPRRVLLTGIFARIMKYYNRTRPDLPEGCKEKFDWEFTKWVWNFKKKERPKIFGILKEYEERRKIIILKSHREINEFVEYLQRDIN